MKGDVLEGFNKAVSQSPAAVTDKANRIRVDAETVAQCDAALTKMYPILKTWSLELGRDYRRLQRENQDLHAEYARLKTLPKWAQKQQLEATYHHKLARHIVAYRVYLAKNQARKAVMIGMDFCIQTINKRDPTLGAKWADAMQKLRVRW
jgi:hypothetical protein